MWTWTSVSSCTNLVPFGIVTKAQRAHESRKNPKIEVLLSSCMQKTIMPTSKTSDFFWLTVTNYLFITFRFFERSNYSITSILRNSIEVPLLTPSIIPNSSKIL